MRWLLGRLQRFGRGKVVVVRGLHGLVFERRARGQRRLRRFALAQLLEAGGRQFVAAQPRLLGRARLRSFQRCRIGLQRQPRRFVRQPREARGLRVARAAQPAQAQHRVVVAHQRVEEGFGLVRLLAQHLQTAPQRLHQTGHHFEQTSRRFQCGLALDAPQQIGDDGQIAARVELAALIGELRVGNHQRPVLEQEVGHHSRHAVQVGAQAEFPRHLVGQRLALLREMHRAQAVLARALVRSVLLLPVGFQRLQARIEVVCARFGLLVEFAHRLAHRRHELLELGRELVVVLEAALRHALDQAARGVVVVAEEARIVHGHAQQRRFHGDKGLAHRRQHALVARDLADQRAHRVQTQHLADLAGLRLQLQQRLRPRLRRRGLAPLFGRQWSIGRHLARRAVDHALRLRPRAGAGRGRGVVLGRGRLRHPLCLRIDGFVVGRRQRLVVFGQPLRSVQKLVHQRARHGRLRVRQVAHARKQRAPLAHGVGIGRHGTATTRATTRAAASASARTGTARRVFDLGAAGRQGTPFGQLQAVARFLDALVLKQLGDGFVEAVELARKGLGHVARPMRTQFRVFRLMAQQLQQRAAQHVRAQRVQLGPHHRQAERRTHERIKSRQVLLDHRHHRLLQARSFDKARHLGVFDQGQVVVGHRCARAARRHLARAHQCLAHRLVHLAREGGAQLGPPLGQRRHRFAQLQPERDGFGAALGALQRRQRGVHAAVDQRRRQEDRFLPGAIDQGALGADGLHEQERITSADSSERGTARWASAILYSVSCAPKP